MKILKWILFSMIFISFSCEKKAKEIIITATDYHLIVDHLTSTMVHDIFSPPVASRIYAYPNIAAYEVLNQSTVTKLTAKLNQFPNKNVDVKNAKNVNLKLASLIAFIDISKDLVFSENKITSYRDSLYTNWKNTNITEFENSKLHGLAIAKKIRTWMNLDNYSQTRTMPKYNVQSDETYRWIPTPPSYMDGIEPHWNKIRPFVLQSASQFKPKKHPKFSLKKESAFYKELEEVYTLSKNIEKSGNNSEEVAIAQFWDCNPFVSVTKGHFMFASKKITPGAHWIGICKIACKQSELNFEDTVFAYTKTSIAIADAFISCWDEKYRSNLIRPETLINKYIDKNWEPILQTPPFPEYTSGHSVVSGSASVILTDIFNNNFKFNDDTEVPYGLPSRKFNSFEEAANEAAISRLYGGIHYKSAVEIGLKQGRQVGDLVKEVLKSN